MSTFISSFAKCVKAQRQIRGSVWSERGVSAGERHLGLGGNNHRVGYTYPSGSGGPLSIQDSHRVGYFPFLLCGSAGLLSILHW